jgi:GntR family transcriptional regulator
MTRLPLYREVKEKLIQTLAAGEWKPGGRIPVEAELGRRYGVGIATVRAAVGELEAAGILARKQGKGTFVSEHANHTRLYRFFNLVGKGGAREIPSRAVISVRRDSPTAEEAELLSLSRYGRQRDVQRLRIAFSLRGQKVGVSDVTLPAGLFPRLTAAGVRGESVTLYAMYQSNFNVNVINVTADVGADSAPRDVARLLGVRAGSPVLTIHRKAYTYDDVPVELRLTWVNTADYRFHVDQGSTV